MQNPNLSFIDRVGKKKVALLSIGPCGLKSASVVRKGNQLEISDVDIITTRLIEDSPDSTFLAALPKKTDCGMVAVCVGWKFLLQTSKAKHRNEAELNIELQSSPSSVMGSNYRPNTRLMGYLTEDKNFQVVADIEEESIQTLEDVLANYNLKVMRAQIGSMAILSDLLHSPQYLEHTDSVVPIIHDQGHICALITVGDKTSLRLFAGMIDVKPPENQAASSKLNEKLRELLTSARAGKPTKFLVADSAVPDISQLMDTFCSTVRSDQPVTWERFAGDDPDCKPELVDFYGLIKN